MNVELTLVSMLAPSTGGTQSRTQSDTETSFAATLLLVTGDLGDEDAADVNVQDTDVEAQVALVGTQTDPSVRPSQVVLSTGEPADEMVPSLELLVLMTDIVDGDGNGDGVAVGKRVAEALHDALTTLLAHGQRSGDSTRHDVGDGGDPARSVAQPSNLATSGASAARQDAEGGQQSAVERGVVQLVAEAEGFHEAIAFGDKPSEPARTQSGQEPVDSEVPRPSGTGPEDASQTVAADHSPSPTLYDVEFPAAVTATNGDSGPAELNQQNEMTGTSAEQSEHLEAAPVRQHLESKMTADLVKNQEIPAGTITKLPGDRTDFNQTTSEPAAKVDRQVSPKAPAEIVTRSLSAKLFEMSGDGESVLMDESAAKVDRQVSPKAPPEVLTEAAAVGKDGRSLGKDEGLRASITGGQWQEPSTNSSGGGRPLVHRQVGPPSAQTSEVTQVEVAGSSGEVVIPPEIDTVDESVRRLVREVTDARVARSRPGPVAGSLAQHSGAGMEGRDGQAQLVDRDTSSDREGSDTLTSKPRRWGAHNPAATTGDAGSGEPTESVVNGVSNGEGKLGAPIDGLPSATVQSQIVKANPVRAGLETTETSPEAPIRHTDWVTLRMDAAGQGTVRIRVSVQGNHVRATILHDDAGIAEQLSTRVGDLRQALVRQGFSESQLSIQPALSSQQVAAAGSAWQLGRFNPSTAASPELFDPDQQSPNDRGRDPYDDLYDRRDTSQRRRQDQREEGKP